MSKPNLNADEKTPLILFDGKVDYNFSKQDNESKAKKTANLVSFIHTF
jgi:hypothetical protein